MNPNNGHARGPIHQGPLVQCLHLKRWLTMIVGRNTRLTAERSKDIQNTYKELHEAHVEHKWIQNYSE